MIAPKTWNEFRSIGLLWWVNTILHIFGWAIIFEVDTEDYDKIIDVYPARTDFRGFAPEDNLEGYEKLTEYLNQNITDIKADFNVTKG
jgi:hypothetical protein